MKISEVRERGQAMGINGLAWMHKGDLIRTIQRAEGYTDCYGAPWRFECPQFDCCWRRDCLTNNPEETT